MRSAIFPILLSIVAGCSGQRTSEERVEITRNQDTATIVFIGPGVPRIEAVVPYGERAAVTCLSDGPKPHGVVLSALIHKDVTSGPDVIIITRE